jgi:tetratricopeptide (TPR) repeat protein
MRIKHIILASAVLVSVSSFAQKDELKKLKRIYEKEAPSANDLADYKANLVKLAPLATEEGDKVYYDFYRVTLPGIEMAVLGPTASPAQLFKLFNPNAIADLATAYNTTLDYEKKTGKKVFTDEIIKDITTFKPILIDVAINLGKAKKDKEAGDVLYSVYQLDKKDQEKLYYAASYAFNGLDYDKALSYYYELKQINYSGEGTVYWASNKASQKEETFNSKNERDIFIKTGTHDKPRDEKTASKKGEIYKNIVFILVQKDKVEEAKTAIADARKVDPDDTALIVTEADLYLKLKDFDTYKKLINQALEKNPNNADLIYNLGVVSYQINNLVDAEKYFLRVIEIDPKYINAYLSMVDVKLKADKPMVDEMNSLKDSYTDKDNKRYQVLKKSREVLFKSVLPYYEKVYELDPAKDGVIDNLLSVYNYLEMTDKYKALKAKQ